MKRRNFSSFQDVSNNFSDISDFELFKRRVIFTLINHKMLTKIGSFLLKNALRLHLPIKYLVKNNIYQLFCGGENLNEVNKSVANFEKHGIGVILDYGAERSNSRKETDLAYKKILETIEYASQSTKSILVDFKVSSLIYPALLEKKSKTGLNEEEQHLYTELKNRVLYITQKCRMKNLKVMIDAEESWLQDSIDELVHEAMQVNNQSACIVYNTIQMYRKDGLKLLQTSIRDSKEKGYFLGVKLVRGAYMEIERERALLGNYASPIWDSKQETDLAFDQGIKLCLENHSRVKVCCASHNEQSVLYMMQQMVVNTENNDGIFAQLMGMSDHISYGLASAGFGVFKYMPYGKVKDIMPYLLRRAEENTSVAGQTGRELQLIKKEIERRKLVKKIV
jgi:proline dehydrogenase